MSLRYYFICRVLNLEGERNKAKEKKEYYNFKNKL